MNTKDKYTFSELNKIIKESTDNKPVIGKNVIKTDAQNNVKAVNDIIKSTIKEQPKDNSKRKTNPELEKDLNRTTLDLKYTTEPSKEYKDRVKAQVHGFPSVENEKNSDAKDNESLDYEGNENFYDEQSEKNKKIVNNSEKEKQAGLKSHNLPKETFKINSLFNENKLKRLYFKNTIFLSESQMINRIPEDYKIDGNKFIMKDSIGNEYIVECVVDDTFKYKKINVLSYINKNKLNEQFEKMNKLSNYTRSSNNTNSMTRLNEETIISKMIDTVKNKNLNK